MNLGIDEILSKYALVKHNEPLARLTGFRTGGNAFRLISPDSRESLINIIKLLKENGEKYFVLGNGTNVLVPDEGYDGTVVLTRNALSEIELVSDEKVRCGAGVSLSTLTEFCADNSLSGVECLYGIPGTVGGAIYMNAGAYGGEISDVVESVEYLKDGIVFTSNKEGCDFGYRRSFFSNSDCVILSCTVNLNNSEKTKIQSQMKELLMRRVDKQPLNYPSCGSTFKRPQGAYASKLVDDCGWRGKGIGGAQVSEKHCGFIVNSNGATSSDILELISLIQKDVLQKTGYSLECEIELMV